MKVAFIETTREQLIYGAQTYQCLPSMDLWAFTHTLRGANRSTRTETDWEESRTPFLHCLVGHSLNVCLYIYVCTYLDQNWLSSVKSSHPSFAEFRRVCMQEIVSQNSWRTHDVSWQKSGNPSLSWEAWPKADVRINELSIRRSFDQSEMSFSVLELYQWVNFTQNEEKCSRHAWRCVTESNPLKEILHTRASFLQCFTLCTTYSSNK